MRVDLTFGFILAAAGLVTASAAADREPSFRTVWQVVPETVLGARLSIPPDGIILKQRLQPTGMVRIRAAFLGTTPEEAMSANEELAQAVSDGPPVFCSIRIVAPKGLLKFWNDGRFQGGQRCFIDENADGVFDFAFYGTSNLKTLPSAYGRVRRAGMIPVSLGYEKADPATFSQTYFVGVQYVGQAKIGTLRRFRLVYGPDGAWGYLTTDNIFTKRDSDLPLLLTVLGSRLKILGGEGKNVLAQVEQMMPPQVFGVTSSVDYY